LIDEIYEATEIHSLREKKLASNVHPPEHRIAFSKLYRHGEHRLFFDVKCLYNYLDLTLNLNFV